MNRHYAAAEYEERIFEDLRDHGPDGWNAAARHVVARLEALATIGFAAPDWGEHGYAVIRHRAAVFSEAPPTVARQVTTELRGRGFIELTRPDPVGGGLVGSGFAATGAGRAEAERQMALVGWPHMETEPGKGDRMLDCVDSPAIVAEIMGNARVLVAVAFAVVRYAERPDACDDAGCDACRDITGAEVGDVLRSVPCEYVRAALRDLRSARMVATAPMRRCTGDNIVRMHCYRARPRAEWNRGPRGAADALDVAETVAPAAMEARPG